MKRLAVVLLCLAMVLMFAGCADIRATQEEDRYQELEQQILETLVPATRFEITNEDGTVLMTQADLAYVEWTWYSMNADAEGVPVIKTVFNDNGAKKFANVTKLHSGQELVFLLDGEEIARPFIGESITNGEAILSFGDDVAVETVIEIALRIESTME